MPYTKNKKITGNTKIADRYSTVIAINPEITPEMPAKSKNSNPVIRINGNEAKPPAETISDISNYETLINCTDDLLWSVSSNFKLIAANKAFIMGLEDFTGITFKPGDNLLRKDLFKEDLLHFWEDSYKMALLGKTFNKEFYNPGSKNRVASWTDTNFNPLYKDDIIVGIACYSRNITEKKLADEKLRQSETRLIQAQEVSKVGSWETDLATLEVIWSQETYNILELDSTRFKASHPAFLEFVHPDDRAKVDAAFLNSINGDSINTLEHRVLTTRGAIKIVEERWRIFRDDEGQPVRAIGTCQDITEQKKSKTSLQQALDEKTIVLERIDDGFFALDKNSIVIYWNKRAEILLNAKREEMIGKNLHEVFANHTSRAFYDNYQKAIRENSTVHFVEFSIRTNKWFAVSAYGSKNGLSVYFKDITEQKNAEEKLKESELRYRSLVEQATDAICILDSGYKFIDINSSGCQLFGYTKEETLQLFITDVLFEEDLEINPIRIEDLKAGKSINNERKIRKKDGSAILIELSSKMQQDGRLIIFGRDIAERKQSERLLKESEAKFRAFFESSMDGILLTITDGEILAANPAACEIFNMTEAEICAAGRFGLFDITDPRFYFLLKERKKSGKAKGELTLFRKGGTPFEAELTSAVFTDSYGSKRTSMIIRDISERKDAEFKLSQTSKELRYALNDLNKIMDSSLDVICAVDADGYFVKVSAAAEAVWGYQPAELVGKPIIDLVYPDDREKTQNKATHVMSGNKNNYFENRYIRKDGSIVPIEWTASWDEKDQLRYGIARDVTEKKKLEKANEIERQRFMGLYLQAPSCMGILKGPNFIFELANPLYLQLVNKSDIVGKSVKEVFPEMKGQGLLGLLETVYKTGNTFSANERLVQMDLKGDGELVDTYLNFIYQAHRNHDGDIDGIVFFVNDVTEQVLSRRKIEESEKRYRQIVETAQEGIWLIDENHKTTFVNNKMCEILEYTEAEMMGKEIYCFMDEEGKQIAAESGKRKKQGDTWKSIKKYLSKTGKEIWVNVSANPLFYEDGTYQGSLAMVTDITERIKTEESNKFKADLLNTVGQSVIATDMNGLINFWNKAAEDAYGWTSEEAIGKYIIDLTPAQQSKKQAEDIMQKLLLGHSWSGEFMVKRKDGSNFPAFVTNSPIYDQQQQLAGIIGVSSDISERKRSETNLALSEKRYRQIVETAQEGIWLIDENNNTTFVNRKMCEILEYTEEEMMGKAIFSFMDAAGKKLASELMIKKMQRHAGQNHFKYVSKSGKDIWTNISSNPLFSEEGIYTGSLAMVTDITEKKQAELQLKESNERYNLISKATNDMVWDWDLVTGKVHRNKEGWKKIFRTADHVTENVLIDDWDNRIHPEDKEVVKKINDEIQKSEKDFFEVECRMLRDDGSYVHIHDRGNILRNEQGKAIRLIGATQDITARKEAELQVAKSELRFRSLVQNSSELICIFNHRGYFKYSSPAIKHMLGFEPEETIEKNVFAFVHPDDIQVLKEYLMQMKPFGHHKMPLLRFINTHDEWRWIESVVTDMSDNPEVAGYVFNCRDVTERMIAQEEIEKLSFIARETSNAVIITNPEGKIVWVNEGFTKITEYTFDEVIGKQPGDFLQGEETNPGVIRFMRNKLKNTESFECDILNYSKTGRKYWLRIQSQPQFDKTGKLKYFFAVETDITKEKEAEQILKASEERYRYLFDHNPASIIIWDIETLEILEINETAVALYGYRRKEFLSKSVPDLRLPVHYSDIKKMASQASKIHDFISVKNSMHKKKTGEEMFLNISSHRIQFNGRPVILAIATDITEKNKLEKELENEKLLKHHEITKAVISAQEQERQELGGELHDNVNQILAGSLLYLGLAKKELNTDHEYLQETYTLINSAIDEIRSLSHSLIPPSLHESAFFDALKNLTEVTQKTSGIMITLQACDFDEDSINDKLKLTIYRIVQEQINNILKHAAAQKVIVHLENDSEKILLRIQDDGVGFDPSKKANGVGLMNIKTRASLFNGEVSINSSPGNGCEVRVLFN